VAGESASRLSGHKIDVTREDEVRTLVRAIVERHGRIDALVNAVGGYGGGSLWEEDASLLDRMLDLNLRSGHALARGVVPEMLARADTGRSSTSPREPHSITPPASPRMPLRRRPPSP
jgi:NAD(P)-dependent dehydrogenase (short-subunit alcohol dehydrogenase family)